MSTLVKAKIHKKKCTATGCSQFFRSKLYAINAIVVPYSLLVYNLCFLKLTSRLGGSSMRQA